MRKDFIQLIGSENGVCEFESSMWQNKGEYFMQIFILMGEKNSMFLLCPLCGKSKSYLLTKINLSFKKLLSKKKYVAPNDKRTGYMKNKKKSLSLLCGTLSLHKHTSRTWSCNKRESIYAPQISISLEENKYAFLPIL